MKLWNKISTEPWALQADALENIIKIAKRNTEDIKAITAKLGRELNHTYNVLERDGVAVLPVVGPLFRYANLFTQISGATSYEMLARDFITALDNPDINAIVFDLDSPGGEVNGCAELAQLIYSNRGTKPIVAYASGDCASGAYWIASACDQVFCSETASLGSIGVVAVLEGKNDSKENIIEIVSSQSPHKRLDPSTDEGKAKLQNRIDALARVFVESVARHRDVDPDTVIRDFGRGDVFVGRDAVNAGLADAPHTLEQLIQSLTQDTQEEPMDLSTLQTEHPDLCQALMAQGQLTERKRIQGILNHPNAKQQGKLAMHLAMQTEIAPEQAHGILCAAPANETLSHIPPEKSSSFDSYMSQLDNPDVESDPDVTESEDEVSVLAKRIAQY